MEPKAKVQSSTFSSIMHPFLRGGRLFKDLLRDVFNAIDYPDIPPKKDLLRDVFNTVDYQEWRTEIRDISIAQHFHIQLYRASLSLVEYEPASKIYCQEEN